MFDHLPYPDLSLHLASSDPLRRFVGPHQDALASAAALLAGRRGERLVLGLVDDLARPGPLSRRTCRALAELLDILALEHVHDDTREEAALFTAIDPADPRVEAICLLTDQFRDALEQADLDHLPTSHRAAA